MIIALVLVSAFLHALWNALLRLEGQKVPALVSALSGAMVFALAVAGVRWGLGQLPFASLQGLVLTLIAGVFEATYFLTLMRAMELGRLGLVYTVSRGGAVLAVWPLSIALFAEAVTVPSIAGSTMVLVGLALSGLGAGGSSNRGNQPGAVSWAVACAMSIAGYHLSFKAALREAVNPSACFALSLVVASVVNVMRLDQTGRSAMRDLIRRRWPRLLVMAIACGGSFLILMEALAIGGSGYVLTLRNSSVLFAVGMAWLIGERPARSELAGAAAVAVGAALMAL